MESLLKQIGISAKKEESQGGANVVIISNTLWHNHVGARRDIIGQTLSLDGKGQEIIGALPATFQFPFAEPAPQMWMPRIFDLPFLKPVQVYSGAGCLTVYAKLPPGRTRASVARELAAIDKTYMAEHKGFVNTLPGLPWMLRVLRRVWWAPVRAPLLILFLPLVFFS